MPPRFSQFLKVIGKNKKVILGLDKTLWQCTIEQNPNITIQDVKKHVHPNTYEILHRFQKNGNSLNIASRSTEPDKCLYFMNELFPNIKFDNISLYPSPEFKLTHIQDCYKNNAKQPNDFILIDDNKHILDKALQTYPNCLPILSTTSLCYRLFLN